MRRASYRNGIDFIAQNDEPSEMNGENVRGFTSVFLMSELFGVSKDRVAEDVIRRRAQLLDQEQRDLRRSQERGA